MSSHTISNLGLHQYNTGDPADDIPEYPFLESASNYSSDRTPPSFNEKQQAFVDEKDSRRVTFMLERMENNIKTIKKLDDKQIKAASGPNSIDSYRLKNSTSPFNATLSQIDAKQSESNDDSQMLATKTFGMKSIKVSRLSFTETNGDG